MTEAETISKIIIEDGKERMKLTHELAKLRATGFVLWRMKIAVDIQKRDWLNLTLEEQYDLFIKENGL